jgi:hypothetical protein
MTRKSQNSSRPSGLTRRAFVGGALAATAAASPGPGQTPPQPASQPSTLASPPKGPPLTAASEGQLQTILFKHGKRLTREQRADLRRLMGDMQKTGDELRAVKLDNGHEPALVFRVFPSAKG